MAVTFRKVSSTQSPSHGALAAMMVPEMMATAIASVEAIAPESSPVTLAGDEVCMEVPAKDMEAVLASIGLAPPLQEKSNSPLVVGSRVKVVNDLFPWVKTRQVGDQGVVLHVYPPIKEASLVGAGYEILDVLMDSGKQLWLHGWEVSCVQ